MPVSVGPGPPGSVGYSHQVEGVEVLAPPWYQSSGPWPAAVRVTELGVIGRQCVVAVCPCQWAWSRPVLWGIATNLGDLRCLSRPGTGARARGPWRQELLNSVGLPGRRRQRVPTGPGRRELHLETGLGVALWKADFRGCRSRMEWAY